MSLMPDSWIRRMAADHGMIEPFVGSQRRDGVISYADRGGDYMKQRGVTLPKL